jgi:enoyl-CoA hydratase
MSEAEILFENRGAVGLVVLNRPKALNALTRDMCLALADKLRAWERDASIKLVVVRGAGDRAFCAGGDIRRLYDSGLAKDGYAEGFYADEYRTNAQIKHYPKPYVALIDGIVMGGGVGVSVHGSHRVVTEKTLYAMPETGIGLFPDVGGTYFLPRSPGETGMYLGLTGARLKAADTVHVGVGMHYVPSASLDGLVDALAALTDASGVDAVLARFAQDPGPAPIATRRDEIDRHFSKDSVEAVVASLEADGSDWAAEQAKTIRTKSPISLKVTFRQIREGAKLGFDDCMKLEFRLTRRFIAGHDFYEGVRAVIVDKDNAPKWRPDRLEDIGEAAVDAYFAPLAEGDLALG